MPETRGEPTRDAEVERIAAVLPKAIPAIFDDGDAKWTHRHAARLYDAGLRLDRDRVASPHGAAVTGLREALQLIYDKAAERLAPKPGTALAAVNDNFFAVLLDELAASEDSAAVQAPTAGEPTYTENAIVGLFAMNKGDEATLREGFAAIRAEAARPAVQEYRAALDALYRAYLSRRSIDPGIIHSRTAALRKARALLEPTNG